MPTKRGKSHVEMPEDAVAAGLESGFMIAKLERGGFEALGDASEV